VRTRVALAVVLALGAVAGAAAADTPYTQRLHIAEALAVRYPGRIERGSALGKYGLWAGIVVQTAGQQRSHRDRIGLWSAVNLHLSVEPSTYAALFARSGARDPRRVCSSVETAVCRAWVSYFLGAERHLPAATLLGLLWHAHTTAIATALRTQRAVFDRVRTTALERNFWIGWIEVVFLLEAAHFPTGAGVSERASRLLRPPCSPLGSPGCTLSARDLGQTFPFVSALALRHATIEDALAEYSQLRADPSARTAIELADPALGAAAALYLAIAGRKRLREPGSPPGSRSLQGRLSH
jgi:hypothetical protein